MRTPGTDYAAIALKTGAKVVPFAIEGAFFAWPRFKKYPRRHPVEISFGKALEIREYDLPEDLVGDVMDEIKKIKQEMETQVLLEVDPNVIVKQLINFE